MKLSKEDVQKIALLARIGIKEEELSKYGDEMSSILEYVNKLQEEDTAGISSNFYITDLENSWREDELKGCTEAERELILGNMPEKEGDLLKIVGVFKK
ncbi:Asp-tRNA(Asn)/Glu-tRNA(Gln) amidotransferase subunit GatC [Candidatus Parcubacteria bacterium]|nr:Asp-tRNA(Asn)/Glu-tRNA(Gln) amidotransferase subunit GatC [Patescibacteria group bacterium]MCG2694266.1 Asp-tRNA(Asn)/Glu-tRNA(Gln) amidotransferase subunit GatC [Candidatus Parcubacteria bacterium]